MNAAWTVLDVPFVHTATLTLTCSLQLLSNYFAKGGVCEELHKSEIIKYTSYQYI